MIYVLLFILELVLLFLLAKKLINSLTQILYKITRNHKAIVHTLAIFFLPGTIVHEMAHLLSAEVMLVYVGEMNLVPEISGESVKLGSVQIGKTDPIRRTIIGVAPVLLGILAILGILYFIQTRDKIIWWQASLALYLVFEIGNTMFSSKKDLEGVIGFIVAVLIVGILGIGALFFINHDLFQNLLAWLNSLNFKFLVDFFKLASFYILVPIILDIIIILISRPLTKRKYY